MKKKNVIFYVFITVIGFGLLALGLVLIKFGNFNTVPYLSVGVGSGIFGHGLGEVIKSINAKKYPRDARQQEILENDERNIALSNRSKAKAFDLMIYVFGALLLVFGIMKVELRVILLLFGGYLFVTGSCIYYSIKYSREM